MQFVYDDSYATDNKIAIGTIITFFGRVDYLHEQKQPVYEPSSS
jgi:hypothetical protein